MKLVRKLMIIAILGTDMVKHFNILNKMQSRFEDLEENALGLTEGDTDNLAKLLLHTADLSHPVKHFPVYSLWSNKICEEFTRQYEDEYKYNLPASVFMKDLDRPLNYYRNEVNFLVVVIQPLWVCVDMWLEPALDERMA